MCSADRAPSDTCRVAIYTGWAKNVGFAALLCNWHAFTMSHHRRPHQCELDPPPDESALARSPLLPCYAPIHMYLCGEPGVLT